MPTYRSRIVSITIEGSKFNLLRDGGDVDAIPNDGRADLLNNPDNVSSSFHKKVYRVFGEDSPYTQWVTRTSGGKALREVEVAGKKDLIRGYYGLLPDGGDGGVSEADRAQSGVIRQNSNC